MGYSWRLCQRDSSCPKQSELTTGSCRHLAATQANHSFEIRPSSSRERTIKHPDVDQIPETARPRNPSLLAAVGSGQSDLSSAVAASITQFAGATLDLRSKSGSGAPATWAAATGLAGTGTRDIVTEQGGGQTARRAVFPARETQKAKERLQIRAGQKPNFASQDARLLDGHQEAAGDGH